MKKRHTTREAQAMCPILFEFLAELSFKKATVALSYLDASSIATATATVIPTMGLLPAPIKPIIST